MVTLDSVSCADTFTEPGQQGATLLLEGGTSGGYFAVTQNDVYVQLAYGGYGQYDWTDPLHVAPGNGIIKPGTLGIRFRNYVAGQTAVVSAGLSSLVEPALELSAAGVSTSGTLLKVQKDGVLVGAESTLDFIGTLWTITDNVGLARVELTPNKPQGFTSGLNVGAANTDIAWTFGNGAVTTVYVTTGGGSLRSFGAPPAGNGSILVIRNAAASAFTIANGLAGGTGLELFMSGGNNLVLSPAMVATFVSDGINGWVQVTGIAQPTGRVESGRAVFAAGSTVVTFANAFSGTPAVTITGETGVGVAPPISISGPSSSGFTMVNGSGGNMTISWIAAGF